MNKYNLIALGLGIISIYILINYNFSTSGKATIDGEEVDLEEIGKIMGGSK